MYDRIKLNILYLVIRHKKLYPNSDGIALNELKARVLLNFPGLSPSILKLILYDLSNNRYIVTKMSQSPEYRECVEKAKNDKRVKNPNKHCIKKHPASIVVDVTDSGKVKYAHLVYCLSKAEDQIDQNDPAFSVLNITHAYEDNFKLACQWAGIDTVPPAQC